MKFNFWNLHGKSILFDLKDLLFDLKDLRSSTPFGPLSGFGCCSGNNGCSGGDRKG
jgi:hypothetical protein